MSRASHHQHSWRNEKQAEADDRARCLLACTVISCRFQSIQRSHRFWVNDCDFPLVETIHLPPSLTHSFPFFPYTNNSGIRIRIPIMQRRPPIFKKSPKRTRSCRMKRNANCTTSTAPKASTRPTKWERMRRARTLVEEEVRTFDGPEVVDREECTT